MVTETSILERGRENLKELKAKDVMIAPQPIVHETTKRSVIVSLLRQYFLILITKDSKPVGVVTKADMIKAII